MTAATPPNSISAFANSDRPWFESWFDSPYYEEVYDHRNLSEAKAFIDRLTQWLQLPLTAQILDLGCGWGRHTRSFAELGYRATGLDLSPRLIAKAREKFIQLKDPVSERLTFCNGDMRDFQLDTQFDLIANLFTSLGYFEDSEQDLKVIRNAYNHLKTNGHFVLDFFEKEAILSQLSESEYRCGPNFDTQIKRSLDNDQLIKTIKIIPKQTGGIAKTYNEKVRCYESSELHAMLNSCGFEVTHRWGTYQLTPAEPGSPRCILLACKSRGNLL
jgi:SAM-dependent methyltransferase